MRSDMHEDFIGQDLQEKPWKTIPRRKFPSRYQHIFYGYCYSCGKFGHKAVECHTYPRNEYNSRRSVKYEPPRAQRNINRLENLRNNIECYKCQKFGHIAKDCRLENPPEESSKPQNERTWKNEKNDNCALTFKAQKNKDVWYVDRGYSIEPCPLEIMDLQML